jgi:hypothetical protein
MKKIMLVLAASAAIAASALPATAQADSCPGSTLSGWRFKTTTNGATSCAFAKRLARKVRSYYYFKDGGQPERVYVYSSTDRRRYLMEIKDASPTHHPGDARRLWYTGISYDGYRLSVSVYAHRAADPNRSDRIDPNDPRDCPITGPMPIARQRACNVY